MMTTEKIQQLKDLPLLEFIGQFVQLKKIGANHVGLCPFHTEKSPSFSVLHNRFKCFGCGKGGINPIDFILILENLNFVDACKRVANLSNVDMGNDAVYSSMPQIRHIQPLFAIKADIIPIGAIAASVAAYKSSKLYQGLVLRLGDEATSQQFIKYKVCGGKGGYTIFPQMDINGNCVQLKKILYDPETVKRSQTIKPVHIGKAVLANYNKITGGKAYDDIILQKGFFGGHLLKDSLKPVAICESEKSSLVAACKYQDFNWVASGGADGCKWDSLPIAKDLIGKVVYLFPDVDARSLWAERAKKLALITGKKVIVIDWLNGKEAPEGFGKYDIADLILDLAEQEAVAAVIAAKVDSVSAQEINTLKQPFDIALVDIVPIAPIKATIQQEEPQPTIDHVANAVAYYAKSFKIKNMPADKYFLSYGLSVKKLLKGQSISSFTDAALLLFSNQQISKL